MLTIIKILGIPFLTCVLMSLILGYLGTHILKREVIFIDIALAQFAAVGATIAHLVFDAHDDSVMAYACSFGCIFPVAAFYAYARNKLFLIPLEAIIGISYAIAAAAALFLVGIAPGGHIHIQQILSGSLLWTGWKQVLTCLVVFSAVGVCFYLIRRPITEISNSYQKDAYKDKGVLVWDFIFYVLLGVVITLSVQLGGIVVVFAFLIIPATISATFTSRLYLQIGIIWTSAVLASLAGLLFAYYLDFSIGPAIALFLGGELIVASLGANFWQPTLNGGT